MIRLPPIADWPLRDRELWNKAVEPSGLFDGGAGAHWAAATRVFIACGYNGWLLWLASKELLDPEMRPADRVTRERVAAYVADMKTELAPYSVLDRIQGLHDALRVMEPQSNWEWLGQLRRNLKAQVRPARDKLSRLKQPQDLMALGERLMDEAEASSEGSARRRAIRYRDGLMIALLAYRLLRRKNLAMMRLGWHLIEVGGSWRIAFAAEEMKTRRRYDAVFPTALAPELECYLDVHRPVLLRGEPADGNRDAPPNSLRTSTRSGCRKTKSSLRMKPSHTRSFFVRNESLAAASPRICFATAPQPRSPSTTRSTSGTLR